MLRLGWQFTVRSGREGVTRLIITGAAVAVGVAIMLCVLADFHAFQVTGNRPCWECTQGTAVSGAPAPAGTRSSGTTATTSSAARP